MGKLQHDHQKRMDRKEDRKSMAYAPRILRGEYNKQPESRKNWPEGVNVLSNTVTGIIHIFTTGVEKVGSIMEKGTKRCCVAAEDCDLLAGGHCGDATRAGGSSPALHWLITALSLLAPWALSTGTAPKPAQRTPPGEKHTNTHSLCCKFVNITITLGS